jgi:pimeloyl-ACP methyl ester carboxylesterase
MRRILSLLIVACACLAIGLSAFQLHKATDGIVTRDVTIGTIPARIFEKQEHIAAPVVVIAHGFAGSQQLMQSFAIAFARNGYIAVTFDFAGHGRNPLPLTGSITEETGATETLLAELEKVSAYARPLGDGRLAVLGHSMASDIVVRFAEKSPDIAATIAVSMFSPVVTAASPRNLLVIVGEWEGMLKDESLRAVSLSTAPRTAEVAVRYGDPLNGTAREAVVIPHTEHVSVLFALKSLRAAVEWLDACFGMTRNMPLQLDARGPWIALLIAGTVLLGWRASHFLPPVTHKPTGAGLTWRQMWVPMVLPAILTPLLLRGVPTHFLPVLVADYLAVHFAVYGLITLALLAFLTRSMPLLAVPERDLRRLLASVVLVVSYEALALFWPLDQYFTNFIPALNRAPIVLAMTIGTLCYFLSDEWLTRGKHLGRGAYALSKCVFLISLGIATALDFERLFFLMIIIPVILLFFLIFGLFSSWIYKRTGDPLVAGIANALAFAWAIGVTFPILAG